MSEFSTSVYLWGETGKPSLVSPESIALYWFLNNYYRDYKSIEVVFANNTDLSPNEELPLLVENGKKLTGFVDIVGYLMEKLQNNDDVETTLLKDGLLEFTGELSVLTEYQMYLNKTNYETFTRKAFSQLLYWPMWYNTPMNYRTRARQRCSHTLGYLMHDDDPDSLESFQLESARLPQSKAFQATQDRKMRSKEELQNVKHNLQYLTRLKDYLTTWSQVRNSLRHQGDVIPADFLLWANLFVQLNLPDGDKVGQQIKDAVNEDFHQLVQNKIDQLSSTDPRVFQRDPLFQEQGNVIMSIYHYVHKFI
ncbi:hypothetical protein ZYGR_0AL00470 [Zygosaccharomyces rouxii]|uniref:Mitochondrial outer membrane transport complex Sam37/metaxin N-terminal domain-containing protein n=1 Tax=Zygosaccharomyces rouxii TaxID=4956 RepID=A0A1Q3AFB3_ZYGRO|nr:hypothetical protein ZYGR_0AL00470 [Zygosaccharomyces rouxii]